HLELEEAEISYQVEKIADKSFILYLKAEKPALWTWLELQNYTVSYSDNFFHLHPGKEKSIVITTEDGITIRDLKENLLIRSLIDTYR
ncbi:MAG: glycoside hydrolase family 2 protein, partial [Halanaerobiales bacterium]